MKKKDYFKIWRNTSLLAMLILLCLINILTPLKALSRKQDEQVIVISYGDNTIQIGFAGDNAPIATFPAVTGRPRHQGVMVGMGQKDSYEGDEAISKKSILTLQYPIVGEVIENFDGFERLLHHAFYNIAMVDPEGKSVLMVVPDAISKQEKEQITQILFDKFNISRLYLTKKGRASLYASGRTTGVVLHIENIVVTSVVSDGYVLPKTTETVSLGKKNIVHYMLNMLNERGEYSWSDSKEDKDIINDMVDKLAYVSIDLESEIAKTKQIDNDKTYKLPDGQVILLGSERFRCVEALFEPSLDNVQAKSIHQMVYDAIMKSDETIRETVFNNIVLTGDCSLFKGIGERLEKEVAKLAPANITVQVIAPSQRKYFAWIGGAMLARLPNYIDKCIKKDEYNVEGAKIVHEKEE